MRNPVEGKITVITGASSALGAATARYLSARGAILLLSARRSERIEALVDELKGLFGDQACGAADHGRPAAGGKGLQHPTTIISARRSRDRIAEPHHG